MPTARKRNQFYNEWDYDQAVKGVRGESALRLVPKNTKADGTPYSDFYRDGLKIYTTITSRMQAYAEQAVTEADGDGHRQPKMDAGAAIAEVLFLEPDRAEGQADHAPAIRYSDPLPGVEECPEAARRRSRRRSTNQCNEGLHLQGRAGYADDAARSRIPPQADHACRDGGDGPRDRSNAYIKPRRSAFRYFKYDMAKQGNARSGRRSNRSSIPSPSTNWG